MSKADESHNEPPAVHDQHDAHGHDDHGAHDDHAHEVAEDFIPENSAFDTLLKVVVSIAGLGLIVMMYIWWNAPVQEETSGAGGHEHAVPAVGAPAGGETPSLGTPTPGASSPAPEPANGSKAAP